MLRTKNLSFLDKIHYQDITIIENKINFISGDSGCGKSTLLKLFNKTNNYSSGEIYYKGRNIKEIDSLELRKEIKLFSQDSFLFATTILENFRLYYEYCELNCIQEEKINVFLTLVEANFPIDTHCSSLSGGEKQRVFLAICLSMSTNIIMLDEPTSALDYELSVRVLKNIINFAKENEKTMIIISHDHTLVEKFSENTIYLEGGKHSESSSNHSII